MSGKRNNLEISADILNVAKFGAKKSHIVYRANLNFKIVEKYLGELMGSGLLDESKVGFRIYTTTQRGNEFIEYFNGLGEFINN